MQLRILMDRMTRHKQGEESVHFSYQIFQTLLFASGVIIFPSPNYDLQSALGLLVGMKVSW